MAAKLNELKRTIAEIEQAIDQLARDRKPTRNLREELAKLKSEYSRLSKPVPKRPQPTTTHDPDYARWLGRRETRRIEAETRLVEAETRREQASQRAELSRVHAAELASFDDQCTAELNTYATTRSAALAGAIDAHERTAILASSLEDSRLAGERMDQERRAMLRRQRAEREALQ